MSEYLFVFDPESKGWWLKIDSVDGLLDYFRKTKREYIGSGFELYWELYKKMKEEGYKSVREYLEAMPQEERFHLMMNDLQSFNSMYAAIMSAENNDTTIIDGFRSLNLEMGFQCLKSLERDGVIYFNPVGGKTFRIDYSQFCRKKELSFPHFTEQDIRVSSFKGGTHYYARVGNVEVRNGDIIKWDTYEEAYNKAKELIESD